LAFGHAKDFRLFEFVFGDGEGFAREVKAEIGEPGDPKNLPTPSLVFGVWIRRGHGVYARRRRTNSKSRSDRRECSGAQMNRNQSCWMWIEILECVRRPTAKRVRRGDRCQNGMLA
jgi:hypothetical protein